MIYTLQHYKRVIDSYSSTLLECRKAIDEIDGVIYDLLIKRIKISNRVSIIKLSESKDRSFFRVFRESEVIRNAYVALQDFYPKAFCVHIWRLFISALLNNERPFYISSESEYCYFMSREYFGSFIRNNITTDGNLIINLLTTKKIDCGCFRYPKFSNNNKWWVELIDNNLKVFACYPFLKEDTNEPVLFIADIDLEKTYSDTTLLAIESHLQTNQLYALLSERGYEFSMIDKDQKYSLFSINGFIDSGHIEDLNCSKLNAHIIGSFANSI